MHARHGDTFKRLFILALAALAGVLAVRVYAADPPEVYLTKDLERRVPSESFDCRGKIYVYGIFEGLGAGEHRAEVVWINPDGRVQDHAAHSFRFGDYKKEMVWFWLKLRPGTGGRLLSSIDPSAGMEDFIGLWSVKFYLDGELVARRTFFVSC